MKLSALAVVGLACGCASHDRGAIAVESNDLGITELEVRHDRVDDEKVLTLRGLDQDGTVVATAKLRTGTVMYGADMPAAPSAGTELTIAVGESNASFVSPDRLPHVIYQPLSSQASTFVALKAVASEIDREAGIRFAPPRSSASTEIPFAAGNCSGSRFPTMKGGASSCCEDTTNTWHRNAAGAVVNRFTYGPAWPSIPVCRKSDGSTGCSGPACLYGPCGAAIGTISGTNGHIFIPTSQPTVCGRDDGLGGYVPEPYTSQTLYTGVTATCLCTGCNADGTAQCGFADDFNRTTGLGSNWNVTHGSFTTDGSYAVSGNSAFYNLAEVAAPVGTYDYLIKTNVTLPPGGQNVGLVARSTTGNNSYSAKLSSSGAVALIRINSGTWTTLANTPGGITSGVPYDVRFVATGSNPVHLEVWVNNVMKIYYNDSSANRLLTGAAGIGTEENTPNAKYDSFSVDPLTPPFESPLGLPWLDDFNRSGANLGSNWVTSEGGYTTDGAYAVSGAFSNNYARTTVAPATNDYSVSGKITVTSGSYNSGLFLRSSEAGFPSKTLYAAVISQNGGFVALRRQNDYAWTWIAQAPATLTAGTEYDLKLSATGSNPVHLEVWLDGVLKLVYDDSSANRVLTGWPGMHNQTANVKYNSFTADVATTPQTYGLPFIDDFNRANNVSLGSNWITHYGTITTDGAFAIANTTEETWAKPVTPLGTDNYSMTADVSIPASGTKAGVFSRSNDANYLNKNAYSARLTSSSVQLVRYNSWSSTTLGTYSTTITPGTTYNLKLVTTGSNPVHLEAWLNGVQRISYDDWSGSRLTTGAVGITNISNSAGSKWDTFRVDGL